MTYLDLKVSIIIPVFNRENLILVTLESIRSQSYSHFECILVDDGSTDNTVHVITAFASKDDRFKVYSRPIHLKKGAPTCRNFGYSKSDGKLIQFFDSDDLMLSEALEDKVSTFKNEPNVDLVISKTSFLLEDGSLKSIDQRLGQFSNFETFITNKVILFTPGPMFERELLRQQPFLFDYQLQRHQEFELYMRIMMTEPRFVIVDKVHCHYRFHGSSIKSYSDHQGEVYYRYTKQIAIWRANVNSRFIKAKQLYEVFKPYMITTIKVALFQKNIAKSLLCIFHLIRLSFSRIRA